MLNLNLQLADIRSFQIFILQLFVFSVHTLSLATSEILLFMKGAIPPPTNQIMSWRIHLRVPAFLTQSTLAASLDSHMCESLGSLLALSFSWSTADTILSMPNRNSLSSEDRTEKCRATFCGCFGISFDQYRYQIMPSGTRQNNAQIKFNNVCVLVPNTMLLMVRIYVSLSLSFSLFLSPLSLSPPLSLSLSHTHTYTHTCKHTHTHTHVAITSKKVYYHTVQQIPKTYCCQKKRRIS